MMVQETAVLTQKVMVNQMATYFMTKGSTLRRFCVFRMFEGYFTKLSFNQNDDLSLALGFSAHNIDEGFDEELMAIDRKQYDSFIDSYNTHMRMILLKSNEVPIDCPKSRRFRLSNPHWRMRALFK